MAVRFTKHATQKFATLKSYGVLVSRAQVVKVLQEPERVDYSRSPLIIAQRSFDRTRVLRVVYRIEKGGAVVITFYPGRKSQYEKNES